MKEKILCVDDDLNILEGFQRNLRKEFQLVTAPGGEEALRVITEQGPFAVVLSDQRMPGMGGVEFLARVRSSAPDSVRMMLTGNADQQTAIDAVNEGNIFRFLTKPCSVELLISSLKAGIEQYRLIVAERDLLENTLKGSIKALVDLLAMIQPVAFNRATHLRDYIGRLAKVMGLPNGWQFEVAAMLSQIGCVTIPSDVVEKFFIGDPLSLGEIEMVAELPAIGSGLINNIPRMETVALMIENQQIPYKYWVSLPSAEANDLAALGAQMLKVTIDYDILLSHGLGPEQAVASLANRPETYNPEIVVTLGKIITPAGDTSVHVVKIADIRNGMVLAEDIRLPDGIIVAGKGSRVTDLLRMRIQNYFTHAKMTDVVQIYAE